MAIYTDPVAQVIIKDSDTGKEWKFTAPDYPFLTGCTINYDQKRVSVFTLSFDIPYENALDMMKAPSPFKLNNYVAARIGYASGGPEQWTPWVKGFLKQGGDGLSLDANGITGQISVQSVAESYGYKVSKDKLRSAGWDPIKILKACADGMGLKANISVGSSSALNAYKLIGDSRGKAIRKKTFDFSSSLLHMSYWDVIKKICKEWNLMFWIAPQVGSDDSGRNLFVYTPSEAMSGVDRDVMRTYAIKGGIDESKLMYPCTWSPEGSGLVSWLASEANPSSHGVDGATIADDTGELIEESVSPQDQEYSIFGVLPTTDPEDRKVDEIMDDESRDDGSKGDYVSTPIGAGETEKFGRQLKQYQMDGNPNQRGNITSLIGLAGERTGNLCRLVGAGGLYNGTYFIEKLTHVYAPGSWEMTLTVFNYGTSDRIGEKLETKGGQMPR